MASANLFQAYLQPPKSVSDYMSDMDSADLRREQLKAAQNRNALDALTMQDTVQQRQQAADDRNALQRIAMGWNADTTPEQRIASLRNSGRAGLMSQADMLEKGALERQKTQAAAGKDNAETLAKHLDAMKFLAGGVMANPTQGNALNALNMWERLTGLKADEGRQQVMAMTDPEQIKRWAAGMSLKADQLLPTIQTRNTGGTTDTLAVDPITGKPTVTGSVPNTVSPDAALSAATQRRGQDLVNARAVEANAAALTKPFEVTGPDGNPLLVQQDKRGNIMPVQGFGPKSGAAKPLTDSQAKALLFGSRAQESNKILADLGDNYSPAAIYGKQTAGRIPLIGGALEAGANAMLSDNNQKAEQAQRDFVNAVLRRESGAVIAESEFANAQKQYFPQPGDSAAVKAQKARNRQIAIQGLLAEVPAGQRQQLAQPTAPTPGSAPSVTNW